MTRVVQRLGLLAAIAAAVAMTAPGLADAAATPGWRIVDTIGPADGSSGLYEVSASGAGNAWATGELCGTTCESSGASNPAPLIEHWDGTSWSQVSAPEGWSDFSQPAAFPGGVWVSAEHGGTAAALHWADGTWTDTGSPGCGAFFWLAAFSASDVWAFSNSQCAARYEGHSWHVIRLPFEAERNFAATSATNFWVLGLTAGKDPEPVLMHWTGAWHAIAVPAVPHPAGWTEGAGPIAASSPQEIWVGYGFGNSGGCCKASRILEHWNGKHWYRLTIPYATSTISGIISDGDGGFWLLAGYGSSGPAYQRLYHYAAGHWSRVTVPAPGGDAPSTLSLAAIPGTRSAWGVASLSPSPNPAGLGQAVIYKNGP